VNYANTAKDKMRGKNRAILNDNLGEGFYDFLVAALTPALARCDGAVYIAMSSSELDVLQDAFRAAGGHWSTFIIWAKNTFTLGRADYQRQYEPMLYGWPEGGKRHWCGDRDQGDVWQIKKPVKNDLHPTMKPVELVERAIRNSSRPGDAVLDCFGGSGTTMIAAEKSGRCARLDGTRSEVLRCNRSPLAGAQRQKKPPGNRMAWISMRWYQNRVLLNTVNPLMVWRMNRSHWPLALRSAVTQMVSSPEMRTSWPGCRALMR
jgi:hypothetical protein